VFVLCLFYLVLIKAYAPLMNDYFLSFFNLTSMGVFLVKIVMAVIIILLIVKSVALL
jgi:hypothetical protein